MHLRERFREPCRAVPQDRWLVTQPLASLPASSAKVSEFVIPMRKDLKEDSDKYPPPANRSRSRARPGDERSPRPGRDAAFAA